MHQNEEDLLLLSGIQHFAFCERQWALIHIEQYWAENVRTVEGRHLHEQVDDPFFNDSRGGRLIIRGMPIVSMKLGLQGIADVVEFYRSEEKTHRAIKLDGRDGWWRAYPVEYKRGKPKKDDRDAVQLCAQAICLEEMLGTEVCKGALYYAQIRHREEIFFDSNLRMRVEELSKRMHEMFAQGKTPRATSGKHCSLCSLIEQCQPRLTYKSRSVKNYLGTALEEIKTSRG
ncbi:MAG TPA: CRISPR-associated protein Cas4 [Clostridiaceae bacterium]|nr:CRISPR-associated protein Cas4 [Clostridiaceae bacterium]